MKKDGIYFEVDDEERLLVIEVVGDVHNEKALRDFPAIWWQHPQVADYDSLLDLTYDHGLISWPAIHDIAAQWHSFSAGRDHGCRTAVVVRDDQWEAYVLVLAAIFPHRLFKVFRSEADARLWLHARADMPAATA